MAGETEPIPGGPAQRRGAIRAPQNFVAGLALLAIAVIALGATTELGSGRFYAVGPGLLPRGVATLLGILGVGLVAGSLLKDGEALGRWPLRGPIFIFLAVAAFALSIRTVGLGVAGNPPEGAHPLRDRGDRVVHRPLPVRAQPAHPHPDHPRDPGPLTRCR